MSTAATIPVFDPQGVLRDIPQDQLPAAVKAGGMPAVKFEAPDKSIRFVPANRYQEAAKAGGKVLPFEQQEVKHPGFWSTLLDDVKAIPGGLYHVAVDPLTETHEDLVAQTRREQAEENSPERLAHSAIYRNLTVPLAETIGVNVPGMEKSAAEGDVGGVAGHAAAVPVAMAVAKGAVDAAPFASRLADAISEPAAKWGTAPVRAAARAAEVTINKTVKPVLQVMTPADEAAATPIKVPGRDFGLPKSPSTELLQSKDLATGGVAPQPEPAAALDSIPNRYVRSAPELPAAFQAPTPKPAALPGTVEAPFQLPPRFQPPGAAGSMAESVAAPAAETTPAPSGAGLPRTLSGESALRQILGGQDNANLLKIARSRGINVTKEAQLKPGVADSKLIEKIVEDFSDDELKNIGDTYLENTRMGPQEFKSKIGAEANKALSMQTYFPDVKIPASTIRRTQAAVTAAKSTPEAAAASDLTELLKASVKLAKQQKTAAVPTP